MNIHAVVDYSFLYYKYKFQLDSGKIRRLKVYIDKSTGEPVTDISKYVDSANLLMMPNGKMRELTYEETEAAGLNTKDISQIYYSIKEIEGFRRQLEKYGHNVTVSVCFDMPSSRKETSENATAGESDAANKYKSNRVKRLTDEDFANIQIVEKLVSAAGHNTYRFEGYEADDIISHLIREYKNDFDYNILYTPDADLLVNIQDKVGAQRYKAMKGYQSVDMNNFEAYCSNEFKCTMPYNGLMLFKSVCGDKSDLIDGIRGFGPKAFDRLVNYLNDRHVEWSECGTFEKTSELLDLCSGYITDEQMTQARESLSLVRPMMFEEGQIVKPTKTSNRQLRESSYSYYNMISLYE